MYNKYTMISVKLIRIRCDEVQCNTEFNHKCTSTNSGLGIENEQAKLYIQTDKRSNLCIVRL